MELYKAPTKCWIKVIGENKIPPVATPIELNESIWFDHIDGMYSYCLNQKGQVVHLVSWAEVIVDEDMIDVPRPTKTGEGQ